MLSLGTTDMQVESVDCLYTMLRNFWNTQLFWTIWKKWITIRTLSSINPNIVDTDMVDPIDMVRPVEGLKTHASNLQFLDNYKVTSLGWYLPWEYTGMMWGPSLMYIHLYKKVPSLDTKWYLNAIYLNSQSQINNATSCRISVYPLRDL